MVNEHRLEVKLVSENYFTLYQWLEVFAQIFDEIKRAVIIGGVPQLHVNLISLVSNHE